MSKLKEMIYDYQKRKNMRQHPVFKQIMSKYSFSIEQTGNLKYLLRQAHENTTRTDVKAVVRLGDWINFYFSSGQKRKTVEDTFQSKQYYGRTEDELMFMAEEFFKKATMDGFNITMQAAANVIYINIIDLPYEDYMRCCNIVFQLRRRNPDMEFSLTSPLNIENYDVDVIAKRKDFMSGITILPTEQYSTGVELSYAQKHEIFNMIYGCKVIFIYSEVNGKIVGNFPEFKAVAADSLTFNL